jgi:Peptidase_C39 like family
MLAWAALVAWLFFAGSPDAHVLDVPYRSQLDGSSYQWANCGPTALSMGLGYYGIDASPWDLRVRAMKAQRSWVTDEGGYSDRYGVFVYNLASVAESLGVHADGLWTRDGARDDQLHAWKASELRRALDLAHPVIVEVEYRALPGHGGSRALDDHYLVLQGTIGGDFVYSDPLGIGDSGRQETISENDLIAAMAHADAPRAAFELVRP